MRLTRMLVLLGILMRPVRCRCRAAASAVAQARARVRGRRRHAWIPIALQRENATLSAFRREPAYTAFVEGWGEYASALAGVIGLYSDPYDRYGRLSMDMSLSCRPVVDTGMNCLGWPRQQAMAFMRERSLESDLQLDTETLRYSVDKPGQALAYKLGSRGLLRLREDARKRLCARFDIKRWHAFVLQEGAMPLRFLRLRMEGWIAKGG